MRKLFAEFFGTFWLVFGGCGAAVFAAGVPDIGIGLVGVSLAFGLTVLTMAYAVGHISGGHFNPAVTFGLWASGRFSSKEILPFFGSYTPFRRKNNVDFPAPLEPRSTLRVPFSTFKDRFSRIFRSDR